MSGTKVKLFLTINLLFNCKCLDVGSPVEMPVFKISIKGWGIRDPPPPDVIKRRMYLHSPEPIG